MTEAIKFTVLASLAIASCTQAPAQVEQQPSKTAVRPIPAGIENRTKTQAEENFPANGTIEWGDSQPIGGDLARLEIWDLTSTPENKVVKIRSGMTMELPGAVAPAYATVYVRAGNTAVINVHKGRVYKAMAMAGRKWHGPYIHYGPEGTTVDFGTVVAVGNNPLVVAMGARDQTASIVPNRRFY